MLNAVIRAGISVQASGLTLVHHDFVLYNSGWYALDGSSPYPCTYWSRTFPFCNRATSHRLVDSGMPMKPRPSTRCIASCGEYGCAGLYWRVLQDMEVRYDCADILSSGCMEMCLMN